MGPQVVDGLTLDVPSLAGFLATGVTTGLLIGAFAVAVTLIYRWRR